jgi:hypothetical protein
VDQRAVGFRFRFRKVVMYNDHSKVRPVTRTDRIAPSSVIA